MKRILQILAIISLFSFISCNGNKSKSDDNKLNVYNWDGIVAPNTIKYFEKEHNIRVIYDLYASNEELLAKLQAGAKGYDLIFPSDYMIDIMIKQNMLEKIDFNNIPNYKNISSNFKNLPFDPENEYSVPFEYSAVGIAVDTSKVKEFTKSWELLFDDRYKGKISMLDDIRYGMVPALIKLGYSINTTDNNELEKAKELMLKQKNIVRAYSSETYRDLLKSGEVWIAQGFTGDVYQVMRENPNIVYFIPFEGSALAIESMCIPKDAPHKYTAEFFINYILQPKIHSEITNYSLYASPNEVAQKYIDTIILNDKAIFLDDMIIKNSQYIQDVGETTILYDKIWTTIKAD